VSNKDVKQDALDNLADALTEDILNTPDNELLREVEEDYGDRLALANKFDQIIERADKQVFGTARSRSSVLDLPYRLLEWFSTLFVSGPGRSGTQFQLFSVNRMVWAGVAAVLIVFIVVPAVFSPQSKTIWTVVATPGDLTRLALGFAGFAVCVWTVIHLFRFSQFLSSLKPRTLAWSATAAAVVILIQTAVITAVLIKEQGASSGLSLARSLERNPDPLPRVWVPGPDVAVLPPALGSGTIAALAPSSKTPLGIGPSVAAQSHPPASSPETKPAPKLSDEEIVALVAGGRQLIVAGDIPNARLVLQRAAEAGNATAALVLGATYDPTILQRQKAPAQRQVGVLPRASSAPHTVEAVPGGMTDMADIRMARLWYEKAKDLGSTEAAMRLERLRSAPNPRR
jgi:hypothetical protein